MTDHDKRLIEFEQTGPNSWKVAPESQDDMESTIRESMKKAGLLDVYLDLQKKEK